MIVLHNFTYDEIQIGQTASLRHEITQKDVLSFAAISGDSNPAHLDPEYAATTPFRRVVAHGMLNGAFISTILGTKLPGPGTIYLSQELKFIKPVYIKDVLEVVVEVIDKFANNRIALVCKCVNQSGELVSVGVANVLAPLTKLQLQKPALPLISLK